MEHIATRAAARRILGQLSHSAWRSIGLLTACLVVALSIALVPSHEGLSRDGVLALFILLFCAGLWLTEAMPAFAVSLLAIGLEIALLGHSTSDDPDWEKYIATWGSPLIWLFFGGFVLAAAAEKTGLDVWMATRILRRLGTRPPVVLLGVMAATAALSMFISNTATATLMLAALSPLLVGNGENKAFATTLLLGIAMAANIGGMGTIIGTPPNAIVAGALKDTDAISFPLWMLYGVPPALVLLGIAWGYLCVFQLGREGRTPVAALDPARQQPHSNVPPLQCGIVIVTFVVTILLWVFSPLHGLPTTVVSFVPICFLTATRILDAEDIRGISWDVLLLIAGGLSLGVAIQDTGLATWLVAKLPLAGLPATTVTLAFCYLMVLLSNLMSNTAAANLLAPLMLAVLAGADAKLTVAAALSASAAMCLPISTPPNAIVYGTQKLKAADLLKAGLVLGAVTPLVATAWVAVVRHWFG